MMAKIHLKETPDKIYCKAKNIKSFNMTRQLGLTDCMKCLQELIKGAK